MRKHLARPDHGHLVFASLVEAAMWGANDLQAARKAKDPEVREKALGWHGIAELDLDGEPRTAVADNEEIDFALLFVAQEVEREVALAGLGPEVARLGSAQARHLMATSLIPSTIGDGMAKLPSRSVTVSERAFA